MVTKQTADAAEAVGGVNGGALVEEQPQFFRVRGDALRAALNLLGNDIVGVPYVQLHAVIEALRASEPIE